jgi:hypothetical protein
MVKWISSIEFVSDYKNIGMGQGGHREDHRLGLAVASGLLPRQ